jgi:hypothetical protein
MKTGVLFNRLSLILCGVILLLGLGTAFAQRPDEGNGKAIKDKIQSVLDKTDTLGARLGAMCDLDCQASPAGQKFHQKVGKMRQAQARVKNAHGRSQDEDYQELGRRRPKNNPKGCDPNDQGCIQAAAAAASDPDFDDERGKDVVEDLDEVAAELDELNAILSGNVPPQPPTPDVNLENAEYFFPASLRPSPELSYGAFIASQVAQKASALADHGCDQTAVAVGFGGNAAAACIVVEGIFQVVDYVYQVMDYISQDAMSAEVTGTYKRTKNIFDQLVISDGNIDAVKAVVEAMGKKLLILEENQKTILQLLTMPQGQRPGFPK